MVVRTLKRASYTVLAATGVGLVLVALFLLSRTAQNSDDFDRLHNVILAINVAGVLVLLVFLVGNLARLFREYRTHVPGAKLNPTAPRLRFDAVTTLEGRYVSASRRDELALRWSAYAPSCRTG